MDPRCFAPQEAPTLQHARRGCASGDGPARDAGFPHAHQGEQHVRGDKTPQHLVSAVPCRASLVAPGLGQKRSPWWPSPGAAPRGHPAVAGQGARGEAHGLPHAMGSTWPPSLRGDTEAQTVGERYLSLRPCARQRGPRVLAASPRLAGATGDGPCFSCPADGRRGHRGDQRARHQLLRAPAAGPPRLSRRSRTTRAGQPRRFVVSGAVAPGGLGDGFARPGGCQTVFTTTGLALLDFWSGPVRRRGHGGVCPTTGPLGVASNLGMKDGPALGRVLGDTLASCRTFGVGPVDGISDGHHLALTLRWA